MTSPEHNSASAPQITGSGSRGHVTFNLYQWEKQSLTVENNGTIDSHVIKLFFVLLFLFFFWRVHKFALDFFFLTFFSFFKGVSISLVLPETVNWDSSLMHHPGGQLVLWYTCLYENDFKLFPSVHTQLLVMGKFGFGPLIFKSTFDFIPFLCFTS